MIHIITNFGFKITIAIIILSSIMINLLCCNTNTSQCDIHLRVRWMSFLNFNLETIIQKTIFKIKNSLYSNISSITMFSKNHQFFLKVPSKRVFRYKSCSASGTDVYKLSVRKHDCTSFIRIIFTQRSYYCFTQRFSVFRLFSFIMLYNKCMYVCIVYPLYPHTLKNCS